MDINKLIETLHPLERKVLPILKTGTSTTEITEKTGMNETEVMRALQWLDNKKAITLTTTTQTCINLGENGKKSITQGLPERKLLNTLKNKQLALNKIQTEAKITNEELNVSIGILKTRNAINFSKDQPPIVSLTDTGKKLLTTQLPEETFLKKQFPIEPHTLNQEEKKIFETLKKRKDIITLEEHKNTSITLLELGKQLQQQKTTNVIDKLTPDILKTKEWKNKKFRRYDITLDPPKIHIGKLHHYRTFLDNIRQQFISLGFTEMTGPLVETEFWNMDALYMPQFHSARDIHDAYFIKEPKYNSIDQKLIKEIKDAHEKGIAGSKGWQYTFDEQKTKQCVLRTQGTACSSRMLASQQLKIPGKYFGITRCFRKDVIDATHLPDFNQIEGIVLQEGLTLQHLFGLLRMFAKEFAGTEQVKLVPGYFPFTEPSAELFAKHPQLGWIELGGAGILRPEVVQPLTGKNIPVIAWGIGIDRIAMFKLGLKDIRDLFSQDLEFLRNTKVMV